MTQTPSRILIVRPSALGDVCRSVPVLASLRAAYPGAAIDWLVRDSFVDAIRAHPALNEVVPFARSALGSTASTGRFGPTLAFLRSLRARRYDLVIDAQGLFRSGLFAWATSAPRRVGFANARELGWAFLTERHAVRTDKHTVDRMLELIARSGVTPVADMRLYAPSEDRDAITADPRLAQPLVVLAPTSRWPGKRWPADRFAALARELLASGRAAAIAIVGAAGEREQCAPLLELAQTAPRVVDLIGQTTVGRLMALIERAALVVANDSAALHMAVGFKRPIVALFGPTRTSLVGPYQRDRDVIQRLAPGDRLSHKDPRSAELMQRISTSLVLDACFARLAAV